MCKKRGKKYNPVSKQALITSGKVLARDHKDQSFSVEGLVKDRAFAFYNNKQALINYETGEIPMVSGTGHESKLANGIPFAWSIQFAIFTRTPKGEIAGIYDDGVKVQSCRLLDIDSVLKAGSGLNINEHHRKLYDEYESKGLDISGVGWIAAMNGDLLTTEQQNRCYAELGAFND